MNLTFQALSQSQNLVAPSIMALCEKQPEIAKLIQVAKINPDYADGQLLHEHYAVPLEMELNCIVVEGTRGETKNYAAIVLPYGKRANTGSAVKQLLNAKKVSFAPLAYTIARTGMEFGSITPVGLPDDWFVLIDKTVLQQKNVIIGGGLVQSKIMLPSQILTQLPNVHVISGLAKE